MNSFRLHFFLLFVLGLFGTMTNFVFVSAVPSGVGLVVAPFVIMGIFAKGRADKVVLAAFLYYFISILSTALYDPKAFLEFSFYRYDGNFIISYAPLFLLPIISFYFDVHRLFRIFLIAITVINLILFVHFILTSAEPSFGSMFIARNAAGGFLTIACSFAFVRMAWFRNSETIVIFLLLLMFLMATYSRGSILGLIGGLYALWLVKTKRMVWMVPTILVILGLQLAILYQTFPIYRISMNTELFARQIGADDMHSTTKGNNILLRVINTWPRGLDTFMHSPIVGTGFGSVNDYPFLFREVFPGFSINEQPVKTYADNHAHHSFFHIAGEQGLVGLGIFIALWWQIHRVLDRFPCNSWIRDGLYIAFWSLIFASFTEHRMTTPSMALPFIISFVLFVGWVKGMQHRHRYFIKTPDDKGRSS